MYTNELYITNGVPILVHVVGHFYIFILNRLKHMRREGEVLGVVYTSQNC